MALAFRLNVALVVVARLLPGAASDTSTHILMTVPLAWGRKPNGPYVRDRIAEEPVNRILGFIDDESARRESWGDELLGYRNRRWPQRIQHGGGNRAALLQPECVNEIIEQCGVTMFVGA